MIFGLLLAPTPYLFATVAVVPIPDSLSNHTELQADGTKTGPLPGGLDKFLKKNSNGSLKIKEAVKLGKALFYDQQLGSDGWLVPVVISIVERIAGLKIR
jgi:cytochrome c peroxidase